MALIDDNSPTARSPLLDSTRPYASTGGLVGQEAHRSYLVGDHDSSARVRDGGLVISSNATVRRAWLQRQEVLAEL